MIYMREFGKLDDYDGLVNDVMINLDCMTEISWPFSCAKHMELTEIEIYEIMTPINISNTLRKFGLFKSSSC